MSVTYQDLLLSSLAMIRSATDSMEITLAEVIEMETADRSSATEEAFGGPITKERVHSALAQLEERGLVDRVGDKLVRLTDSGLKDGLARLAEIQGREAPFIPTADDLGIKGLEPGTREYEAAKVEYEEKAEAVLEPLMHMLYIRDQKDLVPTDLDVLLAMPGIKFETLDPGIVRTLVQFLSSDRCAGQGRCNAPPLKSWEADGKTWVALTDEGRRLAARAWKWRFRTESVNKVLRRAASNDRRDREAERKRKKAERQAKKRNRKK